jgi:hypothetical protein
MDLIPHCGNPSEVNFMVVVIEVAKLLYALKCSRAVCRVKLQLKTNLSETCSVSIIRVDMGKTISHGLCGYI